MSEYRDTEYPHFTYRSWEDSPEADDPLFKLPDPKGNKFNVVTYLDVKPWWLVEGENEIVPLIQLYRVCRVLVGPGYTDTGQAFISGQDTAHVHRIWGWSDSPMGGHLIRVGPKYLKPEFRRPEWEEEYGQAD